MKRHSRDERTKKTQTTSSSEWSKSEKEVAEIILDFHCHVGLLNSIPFSWRCKRKRTEVKNNPSTSPAIQNNPDVNAAAGYVVKVEATSSETESDDQLKRHSKKKTSLKKKKESPLEIIQDLTETKDSIRQEIEKVKQYYNNMKNYNLNLKKKKQELLYSTNGPKSALKNPNLEIVQKVQLGQSNGSVNPSKSNTTEDEEYNKNQNQQQFQMQLQMFPNHQNHNYGPSSSSVTLGININNNDNNGLIALPDLNSTAEELIDAASYQQFDETTTNRVLAAAQARKTRLQIFRLKKPFGNNSKQYLI